MKREDAIAEFGVHWEINPDGKTVREELGPCEGSVDMPDQASAVREAKRHRTDHAVERRNRIDRMLENYRTRFVVFAALLRLHPRGPRILQRLEGLENERAILDACIDRPPEPDVLSLPDEIRMPALLKVGSPFWEVNAAWVEADGIRILEHQIIGRAIYRGRDDAPFDWTVHYVDERRHSFDYDRADFADPNIATNIRGVSLHLTHAAAEAAARRAAKRIIDQLAPFAPAPKRRARKPAKPAVSEVQGQIGTQEGKAAAAMAAPKNASHAGDDAPTALPQD